MKTKCLDSLVRAAVASAIIFFLAVCCCWSQTDTGTQTPAPKTAPASDLVRSALEKELAGDNADREALLQKAVQQTPDDAAARWQLGQVRVGDAWLTPAQVENAAQQDPRLAEYRRRRDAAAATVDDQVALAQWCRKNNLSDEEPHPLASGSPVAAR